LGSSDKRIKVSLNEWELEALWKIAEEKGESLSSIARKAIRRMLEQEKEYEVVREVKDIVRREVEALMEGHELKVLREIKLLKDDMELLKSGVQTLAEILSAKEPSLGTTKQEREETVRRMEAPMEERVTRVEKEIERLREEVLGIKNEASELSKRVSTIELSLKEIRRRTEDKKGPLLRLLLALRRLHRRKRFGEG
jgi:septal ring factor EnvC (AmiA/AmiB activator)